MKRAIRRVRVPLLAPSKLNEIKDVSKRSCLSFAYIRAFLSPERQRNASIALSLVPALLCCSAHAETDVLLMGKSWHFGHSVPAGQAGYDVNQYNWGGGLEYRREAWHGQLMAGGMTYRDSFRLQAYTVYGGYQFTQPIADHLRAFATIRAGYLNGSGWHGPGVLPSFGITYRRVSVEAVYIPPGAKDGYNCVAIFGRISF